jgi:hypothetical protein
MATTFTVIRDDVKARISVGTSSNEAGDAQIVLWAITQAESFMGEFQPPVRTTASVSRDIASGALTCSLTADRIYYVGVGHKILFRGAEWQQSGTTIVFSPGSVQSGDTVQIWYFTTLVGNGGTALTSASTTVNLDCVLGTEWGIDYITLMTAMQVVFRMSAVSPSADGAGWQSEYLTLQKEAERQRQTCIAAKNEWLQDMDKSTSARATFGDLPLRESPDVGLENHTGFVNPLTGVP